MPEEGPHGTTGTMKSHALKDYKLYTNSLYTLSLHTLRVYTKERTLDIFFANTTYHQNNKFLACASMQCFQEIGSEHLHIVNCSHVSAPTFTL